MPATPRQRLRAALAPDARKMMLDASVPEAIRRCKRWELLLGLAAMLILGGIVLIGQLGVIPLPDARVMIPFYGLVGVALVLLHRAATNALRRARAADNLLCPACTYDLRALGETGTCPECGRAYDHAAVRAQWLDAERRLKRR